MAFVRKHFINFLLLSLLAVLFFVPGAKVFFLKTFIHTGLFNAAGKKELVAAAGSYADFSFSNDQGEQVNIKSLQGKVVFINFWATWCPPCLAEMSSINKLYNSLKTDPRFIFIMVDADGHLPASAAFMKKNGYSLPVYQSSSAVPGNLYSGTLPTTIIIDSKGNIVQHHEGIARYDTKQVIEFLQSLL